jgi:hypothetical protein
MEKSSHIVYQKNFYGSEDLFISENDRWVAKDMPSFKPEPFINSLKNYITKFEFDISFVGSPGFYKAVSETWNDISSLLNKDKYFGEINFESEYLDSIANLIKEKNLPEIEKLEAAFNSIRNIKWNGVQSVYTSTSLIKNIVKRKSGNSANINFVLLSLLRKLDFNCNPVVLSTRENGMLSPVHPSLFKLNHVIVYIKTKDKTYLLDATEKYLPYDVLPKKCLNWNAVAITRKTAEWFDIVSTKKDKTLSYYNLELKDDLTFSGTINCKKEEYAAFDFRKQYYSFNSDEEYLKEFTKDKNGLKIIESNYTNLDNLKQAVKEKYTSEISNQIQQIGDEYYFYPLLYEQLKENPFKKEKRDYPIDFAYKTQHTVIVNIKIPENFEIVEIPEAIKMHMNENAADFSYHINAQGNNIMVNFNYSINKELFLSTEYADLKEFYNQIIKKHSQAVVLRKKI